MWNTPWYTTFSMEYMVHTKCDLEIAGWIARFANLKQTLETSIEAIYSVDKKCQTGARFPVLGPAPRFVTRSLWFRHCTDPFAA